MGEKKELLRGKLNNAFERNSYCCYNCNMCQNSLHDGSFEGLMEGAICMRADGEAVGS